MTEQVAKVLVVELFLLDKLGVLWVVKWDGLGMKVLKLQVKFSYFCTISMIIIINFTYFCRSSG